MFIKHSLHRAGFTLIELLIVMAVVAILLAVAVPSYRDQVMRGHRASAQAVLTEAAGRQQQFLLDRRAYATSLAELGIAVDAELAKRYDFALVVAATVAPAFSIGATAKGSQSGDKCGVMSVDQAARRLPAGCW
jgi:type IV pilus assembly protein PilE